MQFRGNIHNRQKHYHSYTTDNFALSELGIASYTLSSLDKYLLSPNPDVAAFFGDPAAAADSLKGTNVAGLEILHFENSDPENAVYTLQRGAEIFTYIDEDGVVQTALSSINLSTFLNLYDKAIASQSSEIQIDNETRFQKKDILGVASKIQASLSGCINFVAGFTALTKAQTANIQLRVFNINNANDSRVIGMRGSPIIVNTPKTISGIEVSQKGTSDSPLGVFQKPFGGGIDNPKDSVAAELDLRFNFNTGKWQGGTHQSLARLITDVDPANFGAFEPLYKTFGSETTLLVESFSIYDNPESNWKITPSVGEAVMLEMQNGNPYMYGPNFIGCPQTGSREADTVRCVNRSANSFKKGEIVLLSFISGEWLILKFSGEAGPKSTKIGKWQFQKFIVNSDNFFKDNRNKLLDIETYTQNITPNIYESKMRKKYYANLLTSTSPNLNFVSKNNHSKINLYSNEIKDREDYDTEAELFADIQRVVDKPLPPITEYDIWLSNGYYQSTIFDQLGTNLGGKNVRNVIGRTNIKYSPDGQHTDVDGYISQEDIPIFWGTVFPDGYTAASVNNLKNRFDLVIGVNNTNFYNFLSAGTNFDPADQEEDILQPLNRRLFAQADDINLLQLPAEIALNGSLNTKRSYPIESVFFSNAPNLNITDYFYTFLPNAERYTFATVRGSPNGLYDMTPINPNFIQFSPLQFGLALSTTNITNEQVLTDPARGYGNLRSEINFTRSLIEDTTNPLLLLSASFVGRNGLSSTDIVTKDGIVAGNTYIKFGPFVSRPNDPPAPLGGPRYVPIEGINGGREKSNLIGIIAAKNKFTTGSNIINFTTEQQFGLPPQVTIAGGQGPQVTILGAFLGWNTPGNPIRQNALPQWGDSTRSDRYDSFGTTALHVRVFDQWPDAQTFYDGRYFSVLHFNPLASAGQPNQEQIDAYRKLYGGSFVGASRSGAILKITLMRGTIDAQETSVDFKEPTGADGTILALGIVITKDTILAQPEFWRLNPVRRGALLTGGGFRYFRKVIGANQIRIKPPEGSVNFAGSGYKVNDVLSLGNGVKLKITEIGEGGSISNFIFLDRGEGFLPASFPSITENKDSDASNGVGAIFEIINGIVYEKYLIDKGPEERVPITRLSLPSAYSKTKLLENPYAETRGTLVTSVNIEGNAGGKYDAFYFMHNDVLHTQMTAGAFHGGFAQYINLQIS